MASRDDWQRRLGPLYGGAVALVSSTPWRWPREVRDEPRASAWLVVLGLPIGAGAWLVANLARAAGISLAVCALLGLAALSLASAAIVERGLAARVDHWDARDGAAAATASSPGVATASSPGVAAVLVLVFATLIRAAAILSLPPARWLVVLVATAVVGRWAAMFLQALGDPIALAPRRSLVANPAPAWLVAALSAAVIALVVYALGKIGILALAFTALAAFALGLEAQRRDGGLTAPAVATAAALGELAVLLVATIA